MWEGPLKQKNSKFNGWKIILYCTGFNLLFEYAVRGINNLLVIPLLPILLFSTYFAYFTIFEDLIVRYRLRDHQAMLLGFFIGIIIMAFTGGQLFNPPTNLQFLYIFGINYRDLLFVNIFWWSLFQTVLTFYLVNRISPRDWDHPQMGKGGWTLALLLLGLSLLIFQLNPHVPRGSLVGYISMAILVGVFGYLSYRSIKNNLEQEIPKFEPSKFYDIIMISTIVVSAFCAIFLIQDPTMFGASTVNRLASLIIIFLGLILGIVVILYRIISKQPISI